MKDLEKIFREHRIACDGMILCPMDDWNAIASQVSDLEAINSEMRVMLDNFIEFLGGDESLTQEGFELLLLGQELLAKARGES